MSRAKTTKIAKRRSVMGLYREIDSLLRHANKRVRDITEPTTTRRAEAPDVTPKEDSNE